MPRLLQLGDGRLFNIVCIVIPTIVGTSVVVREIPPDVMPSPSVASARLILPAVPPSRRGCSLAPLAYDLLEPLVVSIAEIVARAFTAGYLAADACAVRWWFRLGGRPCWNRPPGRVGP